ncbi:MAG: alpha/beta fold hydrolase [Bacteroidia bacterium]
MKNIIIISALIACSFSFNACYLDQEIDGQFSDEFYLRNEGADLPVWVRGNSTAETFIIFLHGGPFDTGIENAVYGHFEPLYADYAMVFFDQRGGGYAHGQRAVELTEEQFVEDVEVLVKLIKDKYPQAQNLFLMGHSYGGFLGTSFLKTGNNQTDFKGWIELAGAHNFNFNWLASRDFSIEYIEQKLTENPENRTGLEERLQALKDTPAVTNLNELFTINGIAFWVAGQLNAGKSKFENPTGLYLLSAPSGAGFAQRSLPEVEDLLVNGNQNPDMPLITLPSLLIYGAEDPIVPVATGENGMEFLGTPEVDKSLIILEQSGHSVWEYEIDLFFDTVRSFIEKYE